MTTVQPAGEELRKAVKWISEARQDEPDEMPFAKKVSCLHEPGDVPEFLCHYLQEAGGGSPGCFRLRRNYVNLRKNAPKRRWRLPVSRYHVS